jgi:hypothetical protein
MENRGADLFVIPERRLSDSIFFRLQLLAVAEYTSVITSQATRLPKRPQDSLLEPPSTERTIS